jgi:hypothetical protein
VGPGGNGYAYSAYFMAGTAGGVFCYTGVFSGDCCVLGSKPPPAKVSAGTLKITNSTVHESGVMMWSASDQDYGELSSFVTWTTGDALTVTGTGDTVAAFTASTTFPTPLTGVVVPSPVSLAHDWTVTWTPAGATTVEVSLTTDASTKQVACRAADGAGHLTIPSAVMAGALAPGSGIVTVERKNVGAADTNPAVVLEPQVGAITPSVVVTP